MPTSISFVDLSWTWPNGQSVFKQLSGSIAKERVGLVGRNGTGKSTLLSLIAGRLPLQAGHLKVSCTFGVLGQSSHPLTDETIGDLFGIRKGLELLTNANAGKACVEELSEIDWTLQMRLDAALNRIGLSVSAETHLTQLSGGEQTRARIAALLFSRPDFLLLDEPTNHLDHEGRRSVLDLLSTWKGGAIVISHDRELLEQMDTILELSTLGLARYGGNWSSYRQQKRFELQAAEQDLANAQKRANEVLQTTQTRNERQDRKSSQGAKENAKGGSPRILLGTRKDRSEKTHGVNQRLAQHRSDEAQQAIVDAKQRIEILQPLTIELPPTGLTPHKKLLHLEKVATGYHVNIPILHDFSLQIVGPERVAIVGPNGSGKSTILSLLMGKIAAWSGSVRVYTPTVLLDQQVELLDPQLSIRDNFMRLHPGADENACRRSLARFRFRAEMALQIAGTLSGGQRLRAGLAAVLGGPSPPLLLILDEPTNHLDIESLEAVEAGLRAYDGALLVVSHDETFLRAINLTRRVFLGTAGIDKSNNNRLS